MANPPGFWSYVHDDDEAEGDRISHLSKDVVDQVQLMTGEPFSLFLDKDAIGWGEDWQNKIDSNLGSIAIFIAVMTPRYFKSPRCRRELQYFAHRASNLGIKELVLPLYYVEVPSMEDDEPADGLIKLVREFQWEDWRDLRLADVSSEDYRRGVARLASQLIGAIRSAEKVGDVDITQEVEKVSEGNIDEAPGVIDQLAMAEEEIPKWTETIESIGEVITQIGQIMEKAATDIRSDSHRGKGFAGRLIIARRVASELQEPTEQMWVLGNAYVSQLHAVDEGFRVIIQNSPIEVQENTESEQNLCSFFDVIRSVSGSVRESLGKIQEMIDSIAPIEQMSRDLRPPLRRLRQGLTILVEASSVSDEWINLIEATGLECGNSDNETQ